MDDPQALELKLKAIRDNMSKLPVGSTSWLQIRGILANEHYQLARQSVTRNAPLPAVYHLLQSYHLGHWAAIQWLEQDSPAANNYPPLVMQANQSLDLLVTQAVMCLKGIGVQANQAQAEYLLYSAACNDHATAQTLLGHILINHKPENPAYLKHGLAWLQKAAEQHDRHAQFILGFHYLCQEKKTDLERGIYWITSSAEQFHPKALCALAGIYYSGKFLDQDKQHAITLYLQAADQGEPIAQFELVMMTLAKETELTKHKASQLLKDYITSLVSEKTINPFFSQQIQTLYQQFPAFFLEVIPAKHLAALGRKMLATNYLLATDCFKTARSSDDVSAQYDCHMAIYDKPKLMALCKQHPHDFLELFSQDHLLSASNQLKIAEDLYFHFVDSKNDQQTTTNDDDTRSKIAFLSAKTLFIAATKPDATNELKEKITDRLNQVNQHDRLDFALAQIMLATIYVNNRKDDLWATCFDNAVQQGITAYLMQTNNNSDFVNQLKTFYDTYQTYYQQKAKEIRRSPSPNSNRSPSPGGSPTN